MEFSVSGHLESHLESARRPFFFVTSVADCSGNICKSQPTLTFSVELLLAGLPIERVSILLGHQSVRITEKHYSPWIRSRQEQLEADVRNAWANDATLKVTGTKQVQIQ